MIRDRTRLSRMFGNAIGELMLRVAASRSAERGEGSSGRVRAATRR
jgi:hypothetical protein